MILSFLKRERKRDFGIRFQPVSCPFLRFFGLKKTKNARKRGKVHGQDQSSCKRTGSVEDFNGLNNERLTVSVDRLGSLRKSTLLDIRDLI